MFSLLRTMQKKTRKSITKKNKKSKKCETHILKNEIIKASKNLKMKYDEIKRAKSDIFEGLENKYKPITAPLEKIVQIQSETKKLLPKNEYKSENINYIKKTEQNEKNSDSDFSVNEDFKSIQDSNSDISNDEKTDFLEVLGEENSISRRKEELEEEEEEEKTEEEEKEKNYIDKNSLKQYYLDIFNNHRDKCDIKYGVYEENNQLMIGNIPIYFTNNSVNLGENVFQASEGLYELIFMKNPNNNIISEDDLNNYQTILFLTNSYKQNYQENARINGDRSYKYTNYIKDLVQEKKRGNGLTDTDFNPLKKIKTYNKNNIDYIFWNNPNRLVERLKLLLSSKMAGHSGLNNEIISILDELRQSGYIY